MACEPGHWCADHLERLLFREAALQHVSSAPVDFRGKVLYVHDLEGMNHLLIGQYPGRKFFLYEYDETKPPILQPLIPDEAVKTGG